MNWLNPFKASYETGNYDLESVYIIIPFCFIASIACLLMYNFVELVFTMSHLRFILIASLFTYTPNIIEHIRSKC